MIVLKKLKRQMNIKDWLNLADKCCFTVEEMTRAAITKSKYIDKMITEIALSVSNQWIDTHDKTIQQVESGLKTQGKLIRTQYDVKFNFNLILKRN